MIYAFLGIIWERLQKVTRAVQNGSGTVFVPGFGTFAIAKTNKRETQ